MEGSIELPEDSDLKAKKTEQSGAVITKELAGKITGHIGTGKNAKDSFIWMTITWSFYIAAGMSVLIYIRSFYPVADGENLLDSIINIWSVFVPIITLALGYAFGKGE